MVRPARRDSALSTEVIYAYAVNLDCSHSASQPRLSVVRRSSCLRLRAAKYEDVIATRQSTKVVVMGGAGFMDASSSAASQFLTHCWWARVLVLGGLGGLVVRNSLSDSVK